MKNTDPRQGLSTLVTHVGEGIDPLHAHVTPIYETSTFEFESVAAGAARFQGDDPGYIYTRLDNPNVRALAEKIAVLEGLDLLRAQPERPAEEVVAARIFSSGMAAATTALQAYLKPGQTIISQEAIYSATYNFFRMLVENMGVQMVWLEDSCAEAWEAAFQAHPQAALAYAETPSNPTLSVVDLAAVAEIAHRRGAWLVVDNTFASPYCQRPLTLGADAVIHSTTKYLSGHGVVIGGAVVSRHPDFVRGELTRHLQILGGSAGPFDAWLTHLGLKTFELRMQRHCENALQVARFLEGHSAVERVYYPGLESHPQHAVAQRQMLHPGGMVSFEVKGGLQAGIALMEAVQVCTLAVSLGNVDTTVEHPAGMSHSTVSAEERHKIGVTDGLVRMSVGIENVEDITADLDQALRKRQ
jgi:methionine-gamma-lyase